MVLGHFGWFRVFSKLRTYATPKKIEDLFLFFFVTKLGYVCFLQYLKNE